MSDTTAQSEMTESANRRALLQDALQAIETLEERLAANEAASNEPIAVIGMGCRFPGGVDSPESFWELMTAGRDAVAPFPEERLRLAQTLGANPFNADGEPLWHGGFIDDIDQFDPHFFGISPREAQSMDPQQRMVLEVAWEALERAGQPADQLNGSATGVFLGISTSDYGQLVRLNGYDALDVYAATGGSMNVAAGRLAFTLGLQGPCMAVDTACSSSLVALHLAMQSLRNNDCRMALAGGVNLALLPDGYVIFGKWGMTAVAGRCKAFDASADGFVRSEGCGMLVCKRLSDALADGDTILAILRGSAVNQDGHSSGLTVPNGLAQQEMLRSALAAASIAPADVQYIEAHGTGTAVGDPIEVEALGAVLGEGRSADQPLFLSSVKTNIGHLESASGVASLIKVILSMQHGAIPPLLHLRERSPRIPWPAFPIEIPTVTTPWPARDGRRIAGVSGFGFSGTNAHIVLESPPDVPSQTPQRADEQDATPCLLPLSARNRPALRDLVDRYRQHLVDNPEQSLADLCHTAAMGRSHFGERAAFVATSSAQMAERLAAWSADTAPPQVQLAQPPRVAFLFTGQGAQYAAMGAALYAQVPVYRAALDRCAALLDAHLDRPLLEVLFGDESELINQTAYTQPALFALEFALSELWRSWGITPVAVLGHSVGEYVAAVVAGVFSLEDGLALIAERGRLMQALPAGGAMAAIFAPEADVRAALQPHAASLSIAAINGPAHTVISGAEAAVQAVGDGFAQQGVRVQRLTVSHAFHSPLIEPALDAFAQAAGRVTMRPPRLRLVSNLTGKVAGDEIARPDYWRSHMRDAVQFNASIETLQEIGVDVLLEIGPQPVLLGMARAIIGDKSDLLALPSLRKGRDEREQLLGSLGALYMSGAPLRWAALANGTPWRKLTLPTYPFQRSRYWPELPTKRPAGAQAHEGHPLLGRAVRSPLLRDIVFESTVAASQPAWLADHRVQSQVVFPGTGYVEMALAAAASLSAGHVSGGHVSGGHVSANLSLRSMLTLGEDETRTLQLLLTPESRELAKLKIISSPAGAAVEPGWAGEAAEYTLHAEGSLQLSTSERGTLSPPSLDLAALQARLAAGAVAVEPYYAEMADHGLDYGPAFRGLVELYAGTGEALGRVALPAPADAQAGVYQLHPALLDAAFHVLGAALHEPDADSDARRFYVPLELEGVQLFKEGVAAAWCHATLLPSKKGGPGKEGEGDAAQIVSASILLADEEGNPIASIERLHLRLMSDAATARRSSARFARWLYEIAWRAQPLAEADDNAAYDASGRWLIFADAAGVGQAVANRLATAGGETILVHAKSAEQVASDGQLWLDPTDPAAVENLLAQQQGGQPLRGVLYLWALDGAAGGDDESANRARLTQFNAGALHLVQALARLEGAPPRLYIGTRGAQTVDGKDGDPMAATLWGFGRSVATELPALRCTLIDLEPGRAAELLESSAAALVDEMVAHGDEQQLAQRGGARYVARLVRHQSRTIHPGLPLQLTLPERGKLEALTSTPAERVPPQAGQVEIAVRATGLNFRDVLNVLGMYPGDPGAPGLECAGFVTAVGEGVTTLNVGEPVLALAGGAFNSFVVAEAALTVRLPNNITFAEAVTLPSAWLTAAYGLNQLAQLQAGERVLIHAAAGGVGIAAVALAQHAGAEVFATAGSAEKHAFLRAMGVRHIYNSRTHDFADRIMADTQGAGVDVVLNSLADAFIERSIHVLAPRGRFLEIGKRGIWTQEEFVAARPEGRYYPYDLTATLLTEPEIIYNLLAELMYSVAAGTVAPLPLRAFSTETIVDAFRFMAQARHIGKVVLTHHPERSGPLVRADGSYLVTGGLGGLGLEVAQWLVEAGAKHITLVSRSAPSPAAAATIAALRAAGAEIDVQSADIGDRNQVARVLEAMPAAWPPLRGIIHGAGVLEDGVIAQQEWARYAGVFGPKLFGAWHLHNLTRTLPLDFFVLFSSAAGVLGSPGQANYAAANAALDMLAQQRRADGLPALSIDWGAWASVGMAAALDAHDQQRVAAQGVAMIKPRDGVAVFGQLLSEAAAQVIVLPIDWPRLAARMQENGATNPLLDELVAALGEGADKTERVDTLAQLQAANTDERPAALHAYVADRVMRVLALDAAHAPAATQPLTEIGMDSLMAVELKNRVESDLGVTLPLISLFEGATIASLLAEIAAQQVTARATNGSHADGSHADGLHADQTPVALDEQSPAALLSHLDELSDADVDALLTELLQSEGTTDESP